MKIDYAKELNPQQFQAVSNIEGPLLILAGAGTGKTNTLKYRTSYLIEKGVSPENILLLTFTNRAANEIKMRVVNMLGADGGKIKACTYHAFCMDVLREHATKVGLTPDFTILSSGDAEDAIALLEDEIEGSHEKTFPTAKQIYNLYSFSSNTKKPIEETMPELLPKNSMWLDEVIRLEKSYTEYKKEKNLVDYNDLILYTISLFDLYPKIKKEYSEKYKYKMVDEYQDTNNIQFDLISKLCSYGNNNIAVVGDPAQCIMGFQGANVQNILQFPNKFPGCKVIKLEQNYRSTQSVLNMANALLNMMPSELNLKLQSNSMIGKKPKLYTFDYMNEEAKFITDQIDLVYRSNPDSLKDIAVLVRASRDSFMLESELVKKKIPYTKYGGMKLMDKAYMKDIMAFLKVVINYKDEIAWFRVLKLCNGVGPASARKIIQGIQDNGVKYLLSPDHIKKKYERDLEEIYDIYEELSTSSLYHEIEYIREKYFQIKESIISTKKTSEDNRRTEYNENEKNYEESNILFQFISGYKDAKSFVSDITLEQPDKNDDTGLTISTIHSAKGKEYGKVYIMSCIDQERDHLNGPVEQEARRCFYVAVTRAKYELILTMAYQDNRKNYREINSFLTESSDVIATYQFVPRR